MFPTLLGRANWYTNFWGATFWLPLSKLTYVAYLTFPIFNAFLMASMKQSPYLSLLNIYGFTWFGIIFTYSAAFFIHILVEAPLMNLIFSSRLKALELEAKDKQPNGFSPTLSHVSSNHNSQISRPGLNLTVSQGSSKYVPENSIEEEKELVIE